MKSSKLSLQADQFNASLRTSNVEVEYFSIAGFNNGLPVPNALRNTGTSDQHPEWPDLWRYTPYIYDPDGSHDMSAYDTSYAFSQYMDAATPKDFSFDKYGNRSVRPNQMGFCGDPDRFGITYFPVVYRISPAHVKTSGLITNDYVKINVIPFRVLATSWEYRSTGTEYDYVPSYQVINLHRDGITIVLHIDTNFLADDGNSFMAIIASVMTVLPWRWSPAVTEDGYLHCYLTIAPACSPSDMERHMHDVQQTLGDPSLSLTDAFVFEGASLGMAVLAAIMGLPAMMYTGYTSQFGVNEILTDDAKQPIQRTAIGQNIVEPIDDIEFKVAGALHIGIPFIFPMQVSWYTEPVNQALARGIRRAFGLNTGRRTFLALAARKFGYPQVMQKEIALALDPTYWANELNQFIFTTAKRDAGWNYNMLPTILGAASTLSDVQILTSHFAAYMWTDRSGTTDHSLRKDTLIDMDMYHQSVDMAKYAVNANKQTQHAYDMAKRAAIVDLKASKRFSEQDRRNFYREVYEDPYGKYTDPLDEVDYIKTSKLKKPAARKKSSKAAKGKSAGTLKRVAGKAAGKRARSKKAAPKRKKRKATKRKTKRRKPLADGEEPPKRKKRKSKKKKGSKKKRAGAKKSRKGKKKAKKAGRKKSRKGGKRKKSKTRKTKSRKSKKRKIVGFSSGRLGLSTGFPMDKRVGSQIPLMGIGKKAKDAAASYFGARKLIASGSMTAKQRARQFMEGPTREIDVRFS